MYYTGWLFFSETCTLLNSHPSYFAQQTPIKVTGSQNKHYTPTIQKVPDWLEYLQANNRCHWNTDRSSTVQLLWWPCSTEPCQHYTSHIFRCLRSNSWIQSNRWLTKGPSVHHMNFATTTQSRQEPIQEYLIWLKPFAPDCEFYCPGCNLDFQPNHKYLGCQTCIDLHILPNCYPHLRLPFPATNKNITNIWMNISETLSSINQEHLLPWKPILLTSTWKKEATPYAHHISITVHHWRVQFKADLDWDV